MKLPVAIKAAGPATGEVEALNLATGKVELPTSANAPIAIAGNTVIVPAGSPATAKASGAKPKVVAYTVPVK